MQQPDITTEYLIIPKQEIQQILQVCSAHRGEKTSKIMIDFLSATRGELIMPGKSVLNPKKVLEIVAAYYGKLPDDLKEVTRKREICEPRQIAMYFIRNFCKVPLSTIGRMFYKDHATALSSHRTISNLVQTDMRVRADVEKIKYVLENSL